MSPGQRATRPGSGCDGEHAAVAEVEAHGRFDVARRDVELLRPARPRSPADLVEQPPRQPERRWVTAHVQEHELEPVRRPASQDSPPSTAAATSSPPSSDAEQDAAVPERLREARAVRLRGRVASQVGISSSLSTSRSTPSLRRTKYPSACSDRSISRMRPTSAAAELAHAIRSLRRPRSCPPAARGRRPRSMHEQAPDRRAAEAPDAVRVDPRRLERGEVEREGRADAGHEEAQRGEDAARAERTARSRERAEHAEDRDRDAGELRVRAVRDRLAAPPPTGRARSAPRAART